MTVIFAALSGLSFFLGLRTTALAIVGLLVVMWSPGRCLAQGWVLKRARRPVDSDQNGGSSDSDEEPPGADVAHGSSCLAGALPPPPKPPLLPPPLPPLP